MNTWQIPPRPLPITVRPMGNETLVSYVCRLAQANGMFYTTLFRHIAPCVPGRHRLERTDAYLNAAAIRRLSVLSGHSPQRLTRALPGLRTRMANDTAADPVLRWSFKFNPQRACRRCTLQRGWTGTIPVYNAPSRRICERHAVWTYWEHHDLTATPEIVKAHRHFRRLVGTRPQALERYRRARQVLHLHGAEALPPHPLVVRRWSERADRLGIDWGGGPITFRCYELLRFPETVALTRFLSHPTWGSPASAFVPVPRSLLRATSGHTGIGVFDLWHLLIKERAEQDRRRRSGNCQFW